MTSVTTPLRVAITPSPGDVMSMRGTTSSAKQATHEPSTQYMVVRAPSLSDIQPPSARIRPDGRLKHEASSPASATDVE